MSQGMTLELLTSNDAPFATSQLDSCGSLELNSSAGDQERLSGKRQCQMDS